MDIIKGASGQIVSTVYTYWTGETTTSIIANLTGAVVKCYIKKRDGDSDANAVLVINGTVTDALNGICSIPILAAATNSLSYTNLFFEIVVGLVDGVTYIRNGVQTLNLKPNVGKTLF